MYMPADCQWFLSIRDLHAVLCSHQGGVYINERKDIVMMKVLVNGCNDLQLKYKQVGLSQCGSTATFSPQ